MRISLATEADLANILGGGMTPERVATLRRRNGWPCVRLSRFEIRFTDAQIEEIVSQHSRLSAKPTLRTAGQTKRSAARRRAD